MKAAKVMTMALVPLVLAACAAPDDEIDPLEEDAVVFDEPAEMTPPAAVAGAMGMSESADLMPLNDSGVSGTVSLSDLGGQTEVMVTLNGLVANSEHAGHIHTGSCDNIGPVVEPLQDITAGAAGTGTMTITVSAAPSAVMNGQHLVAYHETAGDNHGPPVACAVIPRHEM